MPDMAEKIPAWLERVLLPQISELKGEVKVLSTRIDAMDERLSSRIDSLDEKLSSRMDGLDTKMDLVDKKLSSKIDELDKRFDMTQRLAVVEAQLKDLRAKA
jgi:hypothetical protein